MRQCHSTSFDNTVTEMEVRRNFDTTKSLRLRVDQLEKENRELKRSLYDLSLQHHAVVQEWSKTLPPHSSQLKKLLTIDVSRILSNPLVSSIVSSTAAALMSAPATPAHPEASPVGSTTPIQHSNSYTGLSSIPLGTASSTAIALQSEDHSQGATNGSEPATDSMSSQQRSDAILSAVTSALTSTSVFSSRENRGRSNKALHWKCDLAGHTGAAYAIGFAPGSGRFLASGSFDKTVRVWDLWQAQTGGKAEVSAFAEHQLPVSALVWHSDAKHLVSGSFDQTVRVLDVESRRSTSCFFVSGFVQSVALHPFQNSIMFVGTNNKKIRILDARVPDGVVREICNHSIIHSTYMFRHGDFIMSADHQGLLKTWDTGTGRVVHEFETDSARSTPISHIAVCEPRESEEEGRLLAVNCWDNVLRVYNRGKSLEHFYASAPSPAPSVTASSSMVPAATSASSDPNHTDSPAVANFGIASAALSPFNLTPIHECRSHRNKSWPIKSSFFLGADYHGKSNWRPLGLTDAQDRSASAPLRNDVDLMDPMSWRSTANVNLSQSVLLATGSSDSFAYVFDVGGPAGTSRLLQRLEGHRDRVYAAQFHPHDPILATASADCVVKIWGPRDSFFNA